MEIRQAQQEVDQWIKTIGVRYFSELTNMAILTEEVGELARKRWLTKWRMFYGY
jgi:NTP pyrophosphatase (non-canonical NTP hydrolase)